MRKLIFWMIVISLVGLAGCTKGTEFKGKTDNWSVSCSISGSAKTKEYVIRYIGIDETVKNVSYAFTGSNNFNENGHNDSTSANVKISGKTSGKTPFVVEDRFKLTIKWNDKTEVIDVVKE